MKYAVSEYVLGVKVENQLGKEDLALVVGKDFLWDWFYAGYCYTFFLDFLEKKT